jgi:hypothetical protein
MGISPARTSLTPSTPTKLAVDRRASVTPGGTAKYFRVDENGQRIEIPPPGIAGELTPTRIPAQVFQNNTSPIPATRTVISTPGNQIIRGSSQQINLTPGGSQTIIRSSSVNKLVTPGDDVKIECVDKITGEKFSKYLYTDSSGIKMIKNSKGESVPITSELLNRLTPVISNQTSVNLITPSHSQKILPVVSANPQIPQSSISYTQIPLNSTNEALKLSREIKDEVRLSRTPTTPN